MSDFLDAIDGILSLVLMLGLAGTVVGSYQCLRGRIYGEAARQEATAVGQVTGIQHGRGGVSFRYKFSVNGVQVDDYSEVCRTPLVQDACYRRGPVLVYYSYEPYANSRLEDFSAASAHAYRFGVPVLAIGLPILILSILGSAASMRRRGSGVDSDTESRNARMHYGLDEEPDALHIAPRE